MSHAFPGQASRELPAPHESPRLRRLRFERALTPSGWARDHDLDIAGDRIVASGAGCAADGPRERVAGLALPGMPNLHSHAFQRGMAGLAERRAGADMFWSWREVMYRFANRLSPEDVEAVAAQAFLEMIEGGFTSVGEFHYLHHDPAGAPYADPAELSARVLSAAERVGLRIRLLPVFYAHGGFGGRAPDAGQRRFLTRLDAFARLHERAGVHARNTRLATLGLAPHSLRAATLAEIAELVPLAAGAPVHIHAAEQPREVEESLAALGRRPVEALLDALPVDRRWCLVHATHMTPDETARLARSGAVAGLCPITEANLGDGIFDAVLYLKPGAGGGGGAFGVGTDSNIRIGAASELRQLEYSQRLRDRARNRVSGDGLSTGRFLYERALAGGSRALGLEGAGLAPGAPADIVVLDTAHPTLCGRAGDAALDALVFAADGRAIDRVIVGGEDVVRGGRHRRRASVARTFRTAMERLAAEI